MKVAENDPVLDVATVDGEVAIVDESNFIVMVEDAG